MTRYRESARDGWDRDDWSGLRESEGYDDESFPESDDDSADDDSHPFILEAYYPDSEVVESYYPEGSWDDSALPEALAGSSDWQEAYEYGVTYRDAVRVVLGAEAETFTDEDVDSLLAEITAGFSPMEAESFWKSLGRAAKSVGRAAAGIAPTVLPIIGGAAGTFFGGPAGTAVGTALGRAAGGAVGQLAAKSPSRPKAGGMAQAMGRMAMPMLKALPGGAQTRTAVPPGGSSATAQLASLIQNPALLQSLLGALLGGSGESRIGESQVSAPFGAFMNALECLAAEAAEEYHDRHPQPAGIPAYLVASDGEAIESVTVAEVRAARLLETLESGAR